MPSVLIGTSSNLQVSRRDIMSHSSSNLDKVGSSGLVHPSYNIKITKKQFADKSKEIVQEQSDLGVFYLHIIFLLEN